jgi:hypothetical protein
MEPLSGFLMHRDFSPSCSLPLPHYEALSFEWGSQAESTIVYLAEPNVIKEWTVRQRDVQPSLSLGARRLTTYKRETACGSLTHQALLLSGP